MDEKSKDIKVVIFDFDDTMYVGDVWENWEEFFSGLFKKYFENQQDKLEFLQQKYPQKSFETMVGVAQMLSAENMDVERYFKIAHEKNYKHSAKRKDLQIISPKFLKFLKKNCAVYIVSISCQKYLRHYMRKYRIRLNKKNVISAQVTKCQFKKQCYEEILQREGCQPNEILVIGDNFDNDILPAQEVGFQTLHFAGNHQEIYDFFGWTEKK